MSKGIKLNKVLFIIGLIFTICIVGLFSWSIIKVQSSSGCDCSSTNPHIITEIGANSSGAINTSFNYYAHNGIFAEAGHYFKQDADIVMEDTDAFKQVILNSNYDGNGKVITLKNNSTALFSKIGGELKNLTVECSKNSGHKYVVAGIAEELTGILDNITFKGNIFIPPTTTPTYIGGLVGKNISGTIKNCANLAEIKEARDSNSRIGGLVGYQEGGRIESSYNWGNIESTDNTSYSYIGGLVGEVQGAVIKNCYNSACIDGTDSYTTLGGLVGHKLTDTSFSLIQSYNIGTIKGGNVRGGIVGRSETSSNNTYNFNYFLKTDADIYSCGSPSSTVLGEDKTEEEFGSNSTFEGWLFGFESSSSWVWSSEPVGLLINGVPTSKKLPRLNYETLEKLTPHIVTFNKNHQDATGEMAPQELFEERAYPLNENKFKRVGYIVSGWSTNPDGTGETYKNCEAITITEDITLYAIWIYEYTYKLTFNPNGGECLTEYKYVHTGLNIGELPIPTRTGYTFLGWVALDIQESTLTPETKFTLKKDVTATAGWEEITYTINYFDQPISEGGAYTLLKTITRTYTEEFNHPTKEDLNLTPRTDLVAVGFSLEKVALENLTKFGKKVKVSDFVTNREITEIDIYVQYINSKYTLTLDATPGTFSSSGESIKKITVTYGEALSNLDEIPVRTGYRVESWQLYGATEDGSSITITKDTVWSYLEDLTAKPVWKANNYTVNFYRNETSGETPFSTATCFYDANPPYEFPEITREGFTFKGYSRYTTGEEVLPNSKPDSENKTYNFATGNGEVINLYAIWEENQYTLRYYVNDSSLSSLVYKAEGPHKYSDIVKVKTNDEFFEFFGLDDSDGKYVLERFSTTADGSGATYALGQDLTKQIKENTTLDLYAIYYDTVEITVAKHSDSPSVGCSGFKIESDEKDISSMGPESCYMYIIKGRSVTITADISNGYGMVGWYDVNGTRKTQSESYTFTASVDTTYYAKWEQTKFYCMCDGCGVEVSADGEYCSSCTTGGEWWCNWCEVCTEHGDTSKHQIYQMFAMITKYGNPAGVYLKINDSAQSSTSVTAYLCDGQPVTFSTYKSGSSTQGTFMGWYDSASDTAGTQISTSATYTISNPIQSLALYARWRYYVCACEYHDVEVDSYGATCGSCSDDFCAGDCGYCENHKTLCGYCGYCEDCTPYGSWCSYGHSYCTIHCPYTHSYPCACCGSPITSGTYCSNCSYCSCCGGCYNHCSCYYANCGHCYTHNGGKCSDCGRCNNCCTKSDCDCNACSVRTCNSNGFCDSCSTSTCSGCGKCFSCVTKCTKCASSGYSYCTGCCPGHGYACACSTASSRCTNIITSGTYCSSCLRNLCDNPHCNYCTNHHNCSDCWCRACDNHNDYGYDVLCGRPCSNPVCRGCHNCFECLGTTQCSTCNKCPNCCECSTPTKGYCACCRTYGDLYANTDAGSSSSVTRDYCGNCVETGWCYSCPSLGYLNGCCGYHCQSPGTHNIIRSNKYSGGLTIIDVINVRCVYGQTNELINDNYNEQSLDCNLPNKEEFCDCDIIKEEDDE